MLIMSGHDFVISFKHHEPCMPFCFFCITSRYLYEEGARFAFDQVLSNSV